MFIEVNDDGGGGDSWSYRSCKAPVKSSPPTNQRPVFLQVRCPSCRPTNSVKALKGKYHIPWTCLPQAHLGIFQLCLWPLVVMKFYQRQIFGSLDQAVTTVGSHSGLEFLNKFLPFWDRGNSTNVADNLRSYTQIPVKFSRRARSHKQ